MNNVGWGGIQPRRKAPGRNLPERQRRSTGEVFGVDVVEVPIDRLAAFVAKRGCNVSEDVPRGIDVVSVEKCHNVPGRGLDALVHGVVQSAIRLGDKCGNVITERG